MIPEKPQIITTPICYNGDKRAIPESTPLGSNQLSFESGFPVLTSTPLNAGGLPPDRLDFNAALNLLSTFIYYMQSGNQFAWNNQLDYNTGAFVLGSDNAVYFCIKANGATSPNTVQNPTNSTGYWVKVIDAQGVFNINIIADGAVSTAKLANSAVTNAKIANATITGAKLANDTITSAQIAANAVTASELADNAVDTAAIAASAVTNAKIANATITGAKLVNKTITATQIADNTITAAQLAANSVGSSELADNAVDTNAIINLSVTNAKIANSAVNDAKISGVSASKVSGLATVATSGSYNDLTNKPTIPTNIAPLPTSSIGVGQIYYSTNAVVTLPTGGSWLVWLFNGSTNAASFTMMGFRIAPGGTQYIITNGTIYFLAAWRIQ